MSYRGNSPATTTSNLSNVQILDDISASFDGSTTLFTLTTTGTPFHAISSRAILIILGGITQEPEVDYTTDGANIIFTTAPVSGLSFAGRNIYGLNYINNVNDGLITPAKLSTGAPTWYSSGNVTVSGDLNVTGSFNSGAQGLFWGDNEKANFGDGNDLQIYHDGSTAHIDNDLGQIRMRTASSMLFYYEGAGGTEDYAKFLQNGAVELYYDGNKKLETASTGAIVHGQMLIGATSTSSNTRLVVAGTTNGSPGFINLQTTATTPGSTDQIGGLNFGTANDVITSRIMSVRDGGTWTPGSSVPTALVFNTVQDGSTSSTERLRITSDGKIGIKVTSPGCQTGGIHAVHDATEGTPSFTGGEVGIFQRNFNSSQSCEISIVSGTASKSTINFGDKDDVNVGMIEYENSNNAFVFTTNTLERLRIDSNGDVGIARNDTSTAFVGKKFDTAHVVSNQGAGILFGLFDGGFGGLEVQNVAGTDGGTHNSQTTHIVAHDGNIASSIRGLTVRYDGNVGIGTGATNPDKLLDISGGSAADAYIETYANTGYKTVLSVTGSNNFSLLSGYNAVFEIRNGTGAGVRKDLRFDGNMILNHGMNDTANSAVQVHRLIGCDTVNRASGAAVVVGQSDTVSGRALRITTSNNNGTMFFGPYGDIHPGSYTALFHLKVTNNNNTSTVLRIDVSGTNIVDSHGYGPIRPRALDLAPSHFNHSNRYMYVGLDFCVNNVSNTIEVRGLNFNNSRGTDVYLDHILIIPRLPSISG